MYISTNYGATGRWNIITEDRQDAETGLLSMTLIFRLSEFLYMIELFFQG